MRGDGLTPPVLSTYAVGEGPSYARARGGGSRGSVIALSAIAMLGTASAIGIVLRDDASPVSPRQRGTAAHESGPSEILEPGFSFKLDSSPSATTGAQDPTSHARFGLLAGDDLQHLPVLAVLQPNASRLAVAPGPRPSGKRAQGEAAEPSPERVDAESLVSPAAIDCVSGCARADGPPPVAALEQAPELDEELRESLVGDSMSAWPERKELRGSDEPGGLSSSRPLADNGPEGVLLADAQEPVLAEPPGSLAVPDRSDGAGEAPTLDPQVAEGGVALSAAVSPGETGAATLPEPTAGDSAEDAPGSRIAHHLARINERYTSAPAPASAGSGQQAARRAHSLSALRASDEPAARAQAAEISDSSLIIRDSDLVAVKLGDLVSLLEDRFDRPLYVWMMSSAAASKFVTAETLAAAGIATRYDAQRRQVVLSIVGE